MPASDLAFIAELEEKEEQDFAVLEDDPKVVETSSLVSLDKLLHQSTAWTTPFVVFSTSAWPNSRLSLFVSAEGV